VFLIETYIDRSPIEGSGVFAGQDIAKGELVTKHTEGLDLIFTQAQYDAFPPAFQYFLRRQTYRSEGEYVLNIDHERFTNHSDTPNTIWSDDDGGMIAARNIRRGEEITCDYREFDEDWKWKLNEDAPRKAVK
jgi:SET domain-containing protein